MKKQLLRTLPLLALLAFAAISCSKESQKTPPKGTFTINESSIGLTDNSTITISTGDTWTATLVGGKTAVDWVEIDKTTGNAGVFNIKIKKKAENISSTERNCLLKFTSGALTSYVTITQRPVKSAIVTSSKVEVATGGSNFVIKISEYEKCTVKIPEEYSWISQSTDKPKAKDGISSVTFSAGSGTNRTGMVIINKGSISDTVRVFQYPDNKIFLLPDSTALRKSARDIEIYMRSNAEYTVDMSELGEWISEQSLSSERVDCKVLQTTENGTSDFRKAKITVKNNLNATTETLFLYQEFYDELQFVNETLPGLYNYDKAGAKITYSKFKDQYSTSTSKTGWFRIQNLKNKNFMSLTGIPATIKLTDSFDARLTQNYVTKIEKVKNMHVSVVKKENGLAWLYYHDYQLGIIIKK